MFCSEDIECLGQQHNSCALVGDGVLELLVLLLTVFACALHLHLHHGSLYLQLLNLHNEGLDGQIQILNLGLKVTLLTLRLLR